MTARPSRRLLAVGAIAAFLGSAGTALGAPLIFEFEGVVELLARDGGLFGAPGTVQIGDSFSGRFSYDVGASNPDQLPADAERGVYVLASLEVDQSVVAIDPDFVNVLHRPGQDSLPPAPPDPGRDWFQAFASSQPYERWVAVQLLGSYDSAFGDDSLPLDLDLDDFDQGAFLQGLFRSGIAPAPSIEDVGRITSLWLVPEPGSAALLSLGVAALALRRRHGRA